MKTILLLRHGKSDWDAAYVGDHQRPLANRGQKAAARVGMYLSATDQLPERVVCSTSLRTSQTLEIAMEAGEWMDVEVEYDKTVYLASYEQMINCISALPDALDRVMFVGHEPTTSLLAGQLIGGAAIRFPTAAVARIDLNIEHWKSCRSGIGTLEWHVIPKHLKKSFRK